MGYIDNFTGKVWDWTKPFQRTGKFPLDRSSMFASYDDALLYAKGDGSDSRGLGATSYIGQTITVWGPNEKGVEGVWVYSLIPTEKEGFAAELKTVGAGSATETATNYSAAKELSKTLVVGQLIKVANAEEIEETVEGEVVKNTYQAGFYIVEGSGVISALSTSTGSDDEVGALKTRVTNLETTRVTNSEFKTYKGTVEGSLSNKVDATTFGVHTGDKEIHVTTDDKVKWNLVAVDYLKSSDKTALENKITTAQNAAEAAQADVDALEKVVGTGFSETNTIVSEIARVERIADAARTEEEVNAQIDVKIAGLNTASHTHSNKELLDTYTQTEADLADAVSKKHEHSNKAELDKIAEGDKKKWDDHVANGDFHVTAQQKTDWQNATDAINAFLDENATTDNVINTLKEIQHFLISDEGTVEKLLGDVKSNADAIDAIEESLAEGGATANAIAAAQADVDALELVVGTRAAASGIFADLAALVAKDAAHDKAISDEVSAREALADIVGTRAEGDADSVFTKLAKLADGKLTKDAKVNNKSFDENGELTIGASDIKLSSIIQVEGDAEPVYTTDDTIQGVLSKLHERINGINTDIQGVLDGGVTGIEAGNGISVDSSTVTKPKVAVKVNGNSLSNTADGLSVKISTDEKNAISVTENGLFVQAIMVNGNDMETEQ